MKIPVQNKIVMEMYEAAARSRGKSNRHYLGMSEIGKKCDRALWYSFRGFPALEIEGRLIMLFHFGDLIENDVIYWLKMAGYLIESTQEAFYDHNNLFRGHCDGIIHRVSQQPHILEVKSCNDKKFAAFKKKGVRAVYPVYYAQCQCYMGYSGLKRALMVVQNKNNSEIYTERLYFDQNDFNALRNRAFNIISAINPPEKIDDDFECRWCSYRLTCQYPEEIIMPDQQCGTCFYLGFGKNSCQAVCKHPGHPFEIKHWGLSCPDYFYLWRKEVAGKEIFPDKVFA